ncbi:MAG TPA: hypothetical protein VHJ40_06515, partial [Actinomycetota bacterium]|nr:hypothetical protein [Actinomycetota bacterium]
MTAVTPTNHALDGQTMTAGIVVMVALFMAAGCGSERELASPQTASPSSGQSPMGAHSAAELT